MSGAENDFEQSVRYVQAMERECAKRPDLNPRTLAVYRDLLAAAARGADAYLEAAGDFLAVRKAGEADRAMALSGLYASLGFSAAAESCRAVAGAVDAATGYGDILTVTSGARDRVKSALDLERQRRDLLTEYTGLLVAYGSARPAERAGRMRQVREQRERLLSVDGEFSLARVERHPPYRNAVYYSAEQLRQLAIWEGECLG